MTMKRGTAARRHGGTGMRALVFAVPLCLGATVPLLGQCPDGTPPPCGRAAPRAALPAADPRRIAILPFRVSAADTLLGEGLAELVAPEFTGEGSPRSVDMGTMVRAWRRAGGGPRAPLAQTDAMRVARESGAGLVAIGSVVGLGQRLTMTATVFTVPDGETRGRVESMSGPVDSLEPLVRRFTTSLIAASGGQVQADRRTRLSDSPAALRPYMEGLALWRRGRVQQAAAAFERALAEDSLFARAALMRYLASNWFELGTPSPRRWALRTNDLKDRLSGQDQVLFAAYVGERFPEPRSYAQSLADRRRAVAALPESPEAWYLLGDWLYHFGASLDIRDRLAQAINAFERSLALDSQQTVLQHVLEASYASRDTARLRRVWPAFEQSTDSAEAWAFGWLVANRLNDRALLAGLRRRAASLAPNGGLGIALWHGSQWGLSAALADEIRDTLLHHTRDQDIRSRTLFFHGLTATVQGRPDAARRSWSGTGDDIGIAAALFADGDTAFAAQSFIRLAALSDSSHARLCAVGLWRVQHGEAPGVDTTALLAGNRRNCGEIIRLMNAMRTGAPDLDRTLESVDSLIRNRLAGQWAGFENLALARVWESRGNLRRAASAARLVPDGQNITITRASAARFEGRVSALAGDIDGAIGAYRRYLELRRDAEPVLIPQRDSVQQELDRLLMVRRPVP